MTFTTHCGDPDGAICLSGEWSRRLCSTSLIRSIKARASANDEKWKVRGVNLLSLVGGAWGTGASGALVATLLLEHIYIINIFFSSNNLIFSAPMPQMCLKAMTANRDSLGHEIAIPSPMGRHLVPQPQNSTV